MTSAFQGCRVTVRSGAFNAYTNAVSQGHKRSTGGLKWLDGKSVDHESSKHTLTKCISKLKIYFLENDKW